jgi:hypothetical protein
VAGGRRRRYFLTEHKGQDGFKEFDRRRLQLQYLLDDRQIAGLSGQAFGRGPQRGRTAMASRIAAASGRRGNASAVAAQQAAGRQER